MLRSFIMYGDLWEIFAIFVFYLDLQLGFTSSFVVNLLNGLFEGHLRFVRIHFILFVL